jgi:hypothetical protein
MGMQSLARKPVETAKCVFYPGVFNETLGLLFEAHTYFQERSGEEQAVLDEASRLYYANEMTRVTMRLTSVMAWVMVRKAVFAGRISEEEAARQYRLEAREQCLEHDPHGLEYLPFYLGYLSERSYMLYERVARLEALTDQQPVH